MEKKDLNDQPSIHDSITLYDHIDTHKCPIHDSLADALPHNLLNCVKHRDRNCCAFLMLHFIAYCDNPEAFARKAMELIEAYTSEES